MNKKLLVSILIFCFTLLPNIVSAQEESTSSDQIRDKVQEKVNEAMSSPKAYLGTITDISETTIQISKFVVDEKIDSSGEIQQVSTDDNTTFVNIGKTTKEVNFSDLAIGDFVIAMGYSNGNSVLESSRILVTDALTPTKRQSIFAKVNETSANELVTTTPDNKELTIEPTDTVRATTQDEGETLRIKFSDIEEGDTIIAVGTLNDTTFEVRRIHVLSSPGSPPSPEAEE
jgi:sensor c-di-GMP phosphodiesterase-like protein